MTLDYDSFLKWALIKEPSLALEEETIKDPLPDGFYKDKDINKNKGISDYTYQQTALGFEEALNRCASLKRYMRNYNYINLIFNYALHIAIVSSSFEVKLVQEEGEEKPTLWNEPTEALQKLYYRYSVYDSTVGIINSSSSGGSSASSFSSSSYAISSIFLIAVLMSSSLAPADFIMPATSSINFLLSSSLL